MKFQRGHHPTHDMAAAGRKGRAASPWNRPINRTGLRTQRLEAIKRAARNLSVLAGAIQKERSP